MCMTIMRAFQWLTITVAVYRLRNYNEAGLPFNRRSSRLLVEKLAFAFKVCRRVTQKWSKGSMRVDVNISIMPVGSTEFRYPCRT